MISQIDPRLVYPESVLFHDYVSETEPALRLFERGPTNFSEAASEIKTRSFPREEISERLRVYNERLGASAKALANVDALGRPSTLCVIGGQQAGFLGGPAYTAYKILSALRVAAKLEDELGVRVIPIFWLATEDHDFTEINRALFLDDDGSIRKVSFPSPKRGHPIESLPITQEIRQAADEVFARFPESLADVRNLFAPGDEDDYSIWHARIWSRLFSGDGLVLVEPRIVRSLSGQFFHDVLSRFEEVSAALRLGRDLVVQSGYDPPLDPDRVGRPFHFEPSGSRIRIDDPNEHAAAALQSPESYSADVALRPILADTLFPTVASVLGPSELTYHAMLRPLYRVFNVAQPVFVPRHGYTLLSQAESELLRRLEVPIECALADGFDPKEILKGASSATLRSAFGETRRGVESSLAALLPSLQELDPGLEARWRQTASHAGQAIDRLEDRAVRADLARSGLSPKRLQALGTSLRPAGKPQERGLSFVHFAARFGVEWIHDLPGSEHPDRFAHYAVTIRGGE